MKYATPLILSIFWVSCIKSPPPKSDIAKIEFAKTGFWSSRRDYGMAIIIDSSLIYKYYDGKAKEYYVGKISAEFWETLTNKLQKTNFKTVASRNNFCCDDAVKFELIVHWKNHKRRILKEFTYQDSVYKVLEWIYSSHKYVKLKRISDTIKFATTLQLPQPKPPSPKN